LTCSIGIGAVIGIIEPQQIGCLIVLLFKYVRHLGEQIYVASSLFFYYGYLSFTLPNSLDYSGLISGNVSGMINGIFAAFNIPP
jgi:hypothetical protein